MLIFETLYFVFKLTMFIQYNKSPVAYDLITKSHMTLYVFPLRGHYLIPRHPLTLVLLSCMSPVSVM